MTTMSIKTMSERAGVSTDTLRYYERIGLIDPVERAPNGHRRYSETDLLRVSFLKRLRATGMSISAMQYYVDLYRQGADTLVERRQILEAHKAIIQAQVDALYETMDFIDTKIARYIAEEKAHQVVEKS